MTPTVAIIITTLFRDKLLYKTLQSIVDNLPNNCIVLIGDQNSSEEKLGKLNNNETVFYYGLPFDCGAYYSRNFLVKKANEINISYCLISADSIQFIQSYDFNPIIKFLAHQEKIALVGFELDGSKCPWEYNMELTPQAIKFSYSDDWIEFNHIKFLKIDICRNIYLAKTKALLDSPYDEDLKLGGHELNFWNLKQKGWKCYWTAYYSFKRESDMPKEYVPYRNRWGNYLELAKQKLGIKGWVIYPPKRT